MKLISFHIVIISTDESSEESQQSPVSVRESRPVDQVNKRSKSASTQNNKRKRTGPQIIGYNDSDEEGNSSI